MKIPCCQNDTSIKIRIETTNTLMDWEALTSQNDTSIKIRIETTFNITIHPHQQGSERYIH